MISTPLLSYSARLPPCLSHLATRCRLSTNQPATAPPALSRAQKLLSALSKSQKQAAALEAQLISAQAAMRDAAAESQSRVALELALTELEAARLATAAHLRRAEEVEEKMAAMRLEVDEATARAEEAERAAKTAVASSKLTAVGNSAHVAAMFAAKPDLAQEATSLWPTRPPEGINSRTLSGSVGPLRKSTAASCADHPRCPPNPSLEAVPASLHKSAAAGPISPTPLAADRRPEHAPQAMVVPQSKIPPPVAGAAAEQAMPPADGPMALAGPSALEFSAARLSERVDESAVAPRASTSGANGPAGPRSPSGEGAHHCGYHPSHACQMATSKNASENGMSKKGVSEKGVSKGSESEGEELSENDSECGAYEVGVLEEAAFEKGAPRRGVPRRRRQAQTSDAACNTDTWDDMLRRSPRGAAAELQPDAGGRSLLSGQGGGSCSRSRPGSAASSRPGSARPSSRGEGSGEGRVGSRPGSGFGMWPVLFSETGLGGTIPEGQPPLQLLQLVEEDARERACREYLQQCFHYLKDSDVPRARADAPPPSQARTGRFADTRRTAPTLALAPTLAFAPTLALGACVGLHIDAARPAHSLARRAQTARKALRGRAGFTISFESQLVTLS